MNLLSDKYYTDKWPKYDDFTDKTAIARKLIWQKLNVSMQMFTAEGLPDTIPYRDYEHILQTHGYVIIADVPGKGLYAFGDEIGGEYNPYYLPTKAIIANPALEFYAERTIGKDCVVIRNDSMYMGMLPMYNRYASLITDALITLRMACINKRSSFTFTASDERGKQSAETWLKRLTDGKYSVIDSDELFRAVDVKPTGGVDTLTGLIEYINYLSAKWDNDIGINANYNLKRSELHTAEVQLNEYALLPLVDDMYMSRVTGWDEVNKMFGTNVQIQYNSVWRMTRDNEEVEEDVQEDEIQAGADSGVHASDQYVQED